MDNTKKLLKNIQGNFNPPKLTPIATDMYIPNHSGIASHPEFKKALGDIQDEKAKVSSNDTTAGYLNGKLVAGSNITLTENNNGGNETLTIASSGGGSSISFGSDNQIPYTNSSTDDFDYSSSFTFDGTTFKVDKASVFNDSGANVDFRIEGDTNQNLFFLDASTDKVGIGTNAPNNLLHVSGGSFQVTNTGIGSAVVNERTDGSAGLFSAGGAAVYFACDTDYPLRFVHNSRANVLSGGLVNPVTLMGIGINTDQSIVMPAVYNDAISGTTRDLYIKDDGQLGYISSTIEDKENIIEKTEYSKLYDLHPKQYDRKDGSVHDEIGLIAEEVNLIMPEIVSYARKEEEIGKDVDGYPIIKYSEDKTKPETVNYSKLIMPLLIEVQHLKKEIEELKNK